MAKKTPAETQQDKLINLSAQQLAAQVANWSAQLEFQKERLRLLELPEMAGKLQVDIDRLAFDKAQGAWENAFKEASITGTYQGQPTLEWMTQQAQLTGVLNGSQTLQGKLTDAQISQMNQQMKLANDEFVTNSTGYINGQKTFDREKFEQSQALDSFKFLTTVTGYANGTPTLERERFGEEQRQFNAQQAQDAWKFVAQLTGAPNAFKQARAIASMPAGMSDLMKQWAGQYATPGSTSVGSGGPFSLGAMMLGAGGNYDYQPSPMAAPTASGPTGYVGGPAPPSPVVAPGPAYTPPAYVPPPAPGQGTLPGGAPTGPAAPATPAASPQTGAGPDAGFWVWLRVHDRIPDPGSAASVLPGLVAAYNGLPSSDHQAYIAAGTADPGSFQYDLPDVTALGIPANPWLGTTTPLTGPPAGTVSAPNTSSVPGRGFPVANWNEATRTAAAAWNAANPGWVLDGSQTGYHWVGRPVPTQTPADGTLYAPPPGAQNPPLGTGPVAPKTGGLSDFGMASADPGPLWTTNSGSPSMPPYTFQASGVQAPVEQWNYSPTLSGSMQMYPPGVTSPWDTPDVSSPYAMSPAVAHNVYTYGQTAPPAYYSQPYGGNGPGTFQGAPATPAPVANAAGEVGTGYSGMLLPSQINAKNYGNSYQYQKDLGWAAYEDAGWDRSLAQEAFERSLPKTGGPKVGSYAF